MTSVLLLGTGQNNQFMCLKSIWALDYNYIGMDMEVIVFFNFNLV